MMQRRINFDAHRTLLLKFGLLLALAATFAFGTFACGEDNGGEDPQECVADTCDDLDAECGEHDDGCGDTLDCGSCDLPNADCDDGVCECAADTCDDLGAECGELDDGCGDTLDCGSCDDPDTCDDGQCVCEPDTCDDLGAECGEPDDGCGETLDCGTCGDDDTCDDGQCVCEPLTCGDIEDDCGEHDDGCGGTVDCGSCYAESTPCPSGTLDIAVEIETGSAGSGCATSFNPSEATVTEGDIVQWYDPSTCLDGYVITSGAADDDDAGYDFQSGTLITGDDFCVEFFAAGEYDYHCANNDITGTITVEEE